MRKNNELMDDFAKQREQRDLKDKIMKERIAKADLEWQRNKQ